MAFRITYVLNLFDGPADQALSHKTLQRMLDCLYDIDCLYLEANPLTPSIYSPNLITKKPRVVYEQEDAGREDWQDIPTTLARGIGDCLPLDTMVMRGDYTFCCMSELSPGDVIMGDGVLTQVTEAAITGEKSLLGFDLDNGATLRCSHEHRLFLQNNDEVRAGDVRVGDRLKSPTSIPCAQGSWQPDTRLSPADIAWLVGIYVADGWHEKDGSRFAISGDDETPKRGKVEQKDRVMKLMDEAAIESRRAKKYVSVMNRALTSVMVEAGSHAPNKRVPSLRLTEEQVRQVLDGLKTDASLSNSGTFTHGTVSPTLALQLRVLYRMLGQSVHIRRWDNHGGLGENPIYRVTVRDHAEADAPKNWQTRAKNNANSAKVKGIRDLEPELCCDITTDTGRFYLPESDLVVHNCEDLACWRAAELTVKEKIPARPTFTVKKRANGGMLYHILVRYPNGSVEDPSKKLGM